MGQRPTGPNKGVENAQHDEESAQKSGRQKTGDHGDKENQIRQRLLVKKPPRTGRFF